MHKAYAKRVRLGQESGHGRVLRIALRVSGWLQGIGSAGVVHKAPHGSTPCTNNLEWVFYLYCEISQCKTVHECIGTPLSLVPVNAV